MKPFEKHLAVETMKRMDEVQRYYKELVFKVGNRELWKEDEALKMIKLFQIDREIEQTNEFLEENMDNAEVLEVLQKFEQTVFNVLTVLKYREEDILSVKNGLLETIMELVEEVSKEILSLNLDLKSRIKEWEETCSEVENEITEESEEQIMERLNKLKN